MTPRHLLEKLQVALLGTTDVLIHNTRDIIFIAPMVLFTLEIHIVLMFARSFVDKNIKLKECICYRYQRSLTCLSGSNNLFEIDMSAYLVN